MMLLNEGSIHPCASVRGNSNLACGSCLQDRFFPASGGIAGKIGKDWTQQLVTRYWYCTKHLRDLTMYQGYPATVAHWFAKCTETVWSRDVAQDCSSCTDLFLQCDFL